MAKLILGTVQFGLDYGVANKSGKPDFDTVKSILDCAYLNGIDELDTADAYGDSQKILAQYSNLSENKFKIMSKFIDDGSMSFLNYFESTLAILNRASLDGYYFHRYADYEKFSSFEDVARLKIEGKLKKFGVSLYSIDELQKVVFDKNIDLIQLPFNALDNGVYKRDFLRIAKENNKTIYIRSAFLQGVLLLEENSLPKHLEKLQPHISYLKKHADELGLSMVDLCIGYLNACNFIDGILIGVDSVEQLMVNIKGSKVTLSKDSVDYIQKGIAWDSELLNPAKWGKI